MIKNIIIIFNIIF